jgi:hypothetical protein
MEPEVNEWGRRKRLWTGTDPPLFADARWSLQASRYIFMHLHLHVDRYDRFRPSVRDDAVVQTRQVDAATTWRRPVETLAGIECKVAILSGDGSVDRGVEM